MKASEIKKILRSLSNTEHAADATRFFKTGKGQYGEGDLFLGIRAPVLRHYVRRCRGTPLEENLKLLRSQYHEERLFSLFLLVQEFSRSDEEQRELIYSAYLENTQYINNWDLVDSSAYFIVGPWLMDKKRQRLVELANSNSMWERRIAIVATFHFIRHNQFKDTLKIARILLNDEQDLIHKAVGWMLRETGNRDREIEVAFLDKYYQKMPRTMLRYAIEKFDKAHRQAYLEGSR